METTVTTIRSSRATFIFFGLMGALFGLPGLYYLMWFGQLQSLVLVLFGVGAFVPALRYRVSWDATMLSYRGVLTTRHVALSDVSKFDVHGAAAGRPLDPTIGLRLFSASTQKPSIIINLKPFSRSDIALLVQRLRQN